VVSAGHFTRSFNPVVIAGCHGPPLAPQGF
jgi:hypothetical protein